MFHVELYEITDFRKKDAGLLTGLYFSKKLTLNMVFLEGQFRIFFPGLTDHLLWSLTNLLTNCLSVFDHFVGLGLK